MRRDPCNPWIVNVSQSHALFPAVCQNRCLGSSNSPGSSHVTSERSSVRQIHLTSLGLKKVLKHRTQFLKSWHKSSFYQELDLVLNLDHSLYASRFLPLAPRSIRQASLQLPGRCWPKPRWPSLNKATLERPSSYSTSP